MSAAPANVGILVQHQTAPVLLALGDLLRARSGSAVHLFVRGEREREHFAGLNAAGRWASVTDCNVMPKALALPVADEAATVARARDLERRLGRTINELVLTHRHFGRGFSPLAVGLAESPLYRAVSYPAMLQAYCETLEFWIEQLAAKRIDLLLQGNTEALAAAGALAIIHRRLNVGRYRDLCYWTADEFQSSPELEAAYRRIAKAPPPDIDQPYGANIRKRRFIARRRSAWLSAQDSLRNGLRWAKWRLRGRDPAQAQELRSALLLPWQRWSALRAAKRLMSVRLADLAGRPFIYAPLQKEPEAAFQARSPEYFSQHGMILSLARDAPAGVLIAVKENLPSIGQRPRDFYRQLRQLRNVVLLDPDESGITCARAAAATAVIVGTGGLEAAVYGKPVITYGRHGLYNFLPHVMTVTDEAQLKGYMSRIFGGAIDPVRAADDGARFLAALVAVSFDTGAALREDGREAADAAANAFEPLLRSLQWPQTRASLAAE
jgi:hypothetical protein